ncbi:MAG: CDP-alcohol phosphatidyltransferase family protein [Alicyclobacillaceae bacterium]|nr:CDP-alcohol phosphatidyltransferase family protein [Alicyclobacillaceae bacterium]
MTDFERINACAKRPIDIWTNYLYYFFSLRLVYALRNTRITPNVVTILSLLLALAGCALFALGDRRDVVAGLVLVQVAYVFDCADGQLARFRQHFSPLGGWLDQVADRIKEFAIYFSLAWGYSRLHPGGASVWKWAMIALFALYLLEYQEQIRSRPSSPRGASPAAAPRAESPAKEAGDERSASRFERLRRYRALVPFRGFIIGEQYFALLVFVAFDAILPLLQFTALMGLAMCIYRPAVRAYKSLRGMVRGA